MSRRRPTAFVLAALVGVTAFLSLALEVKVAAGLTPHTPILIVGNADFTPANGVSSGTGTPSDPYVIEGWDINASTAVGIDVRNTNTPFVIRDVLG